MPRVRALEKNGHTYESEGSVYFKIATLPQYGRLARLDHDGLKAGARVDAEARLAQVTRELQAAAGEVAQLVAP